MVYSLLDNFILLALAVAGMFYTDYPVWLVILCALCLVWVTYRSFEDERRPWMKVCEAAVFSAFSLVSGSWFIYVVFMLAREWKIAIRVLFGALLFAMYYMLTGENASMAECILRILLLLLLDAVVFLIYEVIAQSEKRKRENGKRMEQATLSELHEKQLNEQLMMQKVVDERNARLTERENISRNIHNSVGHSITAAIMTLDAADMIFEAKPDEAHQRMNDANDRMRGSLESIRRAVRVLDEDDVPIAVSDVKAQFASIVKEFVMDTSIRVVQNYEEIADDIRIPNDQAVFLTGVLSELLTNGVKHGKADEFLVFLNGDSAHIRLKVSDNGHSDFGGDNRDTLLSQGFGLRKITSYVEQNGGKVSYVNENGFRTVLELPLLGDKEQK